MTEEPYSQQRLPYSAERPTNEPTLVLNDILTRTFYATHYTEPLWERLRFLDHFRADARLRAYSLEYTQEAVEKLRTWQGRISLLHRYASANKEFFSFLPELDEQLRRIEERLQQEEPLLKKIVQEEERAFLFPRRRLTG